MDRGASRGEEMEWRGETPLSLTVKSEGRLLVEGHVGLMLFSLFLWVFKKWFLHF